MFCCWISKNKRLVDQLENAIESYIKWNSTQFQGWINVALLLTQLYKTYCDLWKRWDLNITFLKHKTVPLYLNKNRRSNFKNVYPLPLMKISTKSERQMHFWPELKDFFFFFFFFVVYNRICSFSRKLFI